ncbi:hypothetical protein Ana3638_20960 [Anaerocolumna sedimenticola]|uniref:DUF5050 domain-containing protein n=1 Tax=Anaerocolumna sedimenticola TaxID=2696063 RepID=A0A6P1TU34_9FIRM|nr:hypothetical protein [Anaerocolumna sedimenticola]QHQ62945.1 hypothetical protein Ana3638_20960 [Anaerocolumna sedimenticola]
MKRKLRILLTLLILVILGACRNDTGVIKTDESMTGAADSKQGETKVGNSVESTGDQTNESMDESNAGETDESIKVPTADTMDESSDVIEPNTLYAEGEDNAIDNPVLLPAPPFSYYISDKVTDKENKPIQLNERSSKANEITDDEYWFINNELSMNTSQIPVPSQDTTGNLQDEIYSVWNDLLITSAFYDDSYIYCTYGSDYSEGYILNIYDAITLKLIYSLDFSNYRYSPDYMKEDYDYIQQKVVWASIKNNILYISHSHNTYAKSSKNMNAYITAIDLLDMSVLWRTDALVCNSRNFQIHGDVIICGYGFTNEPDYLYQIDINTGKVLDKMQLKSAASYIIQKDDVVFVRTYNTDYEFDIQEK